MSERMLSQAEIDQEVAMQAETRMEHPDYPAPEQPDGGDDVETY